MKNGLLKLVELASGGGPEFEIKGKLRCFSRLAVALARFDVARGGRLLFCQFPPDYEARDGICNGEFKQVVEENVYRVIQKFTKSTSRR